MSELGQSGDITDEKDYMTLQEVAALLRFSPDTLRRHMRAGKLDEIEWVDFLENGKLRATTESVKAFEQNRRKATQGVYSQPLRKSRA